ncbi:MAG: polyprenyl synthetase family protein [Magnetococcales bacterium]|nr:polyprenyl synthetase family protein [Magnetococcales bacterium]NGZ06713.1 polyprenyl synthetase family protein [Magnetococcales bacterium]
MELQVYLDDRKLLVEKHLDLHVPSASRPPQRLNAAIRHSLLGGGGKRLRPILLLASAEAVGSSLEPVLPMACALECIHTYSLIHDDLPAMDNDDLRRGIPTCHKAFDEATAILAGDALLTLAFQLAATPVPGQPDSTVLAMIAQLARDAGIFGMVGGQMLDIQAENRETTLAELQNIHIHKTGALIRAACLIGARLGGGDEEQIRRINRYGEAFGLAFQITDDILDVIGDARIMGKKPGTDQKNHKASYPALMGLAQARQEAKLMVQEALEALSPLGPAADPLRALVGLLLDRTH